MQNQGEQSSSNSNRQVEDQSFKQLSGRHEQSQQRDGRVEADSGEVEQMQEGAESLNGLYVSVLCFCPNWTPFRRGAETRVRNRRGEGFLEIHRKNIRGGVSFKEQGLSQCCHGNTSSETDPHLS